MNRRAPLSRSIVIVLSCFLTMACGSLPRDPEGTLRRVQGGRLREDGDTLTGEAFVVPRDERDLLKRLRQASEAAHALDWRLHDIQIVPVSSLGREQGEKAGAAGA
jgi:hypothetical protein